MSAIWLVWNTHTSQFLGCGLAQLVSGAWRIFQPVAHPHIRLQPQQFCRRLLRVLGLIRTDLCNCQRPQCGHVRAVEAQGLLGQCDRAFVILGSDVRRCCLRQKKEAVRVQGRQVQRTFRVALAFVATVLDGAEHTTQPEAPRIVRV